MIQSVLIVLIFVAAGGYLVYLAHKQFFPENGGCPKGCGCGKIEVDAIEKEIKKENV